MRIGLYISPSHAVPPDEQNILAPWVLVQELANGLMANGHDVTLFAAKGSKTRAHLVHGGIAPTAHSAPEYRDSEAYRSFVIARELLLFREVIAHAKAGKIDMVHVHQPVERLYPALAALPPKFPVIITFHDPIRPERFPALEKLARLGNIHFVALSHAQKEGVPFPFAGVVPNGVDTKLFTPDEETQSVLRRVPFAAHPSSIGNLRATGAGGPPRRGPLVGVLGGKPPAGPAESYLRVTGSEKVHATAQDISIQDPRPLLMTGRIVEAKGFADAIEASRSAGERLLLVGEEYMQNKPAREYFEKFIKPAVDGKHVIWESVVKQEHLVGHYQTAKALLFPIHWEEPFGLVMIEAMACGTPVIAYNRGSVSEIVRDGLTGFIVNPDDVKSYNKVHIKATGKQGLIEAIHRIGELDRGACRVHVEEHFSLRTMVNGYEKIYQQTVSEKERMTVRKLHL